MNITVLEGHRGEKRQNMLYFSGKSQLIWPHGDHNKLPSMAVDLIPYPIDWKDRERMTLMAGLMIGIGSKRGLKIGWGGDWNHDMFVHDNDFDDLVHFWVIEDSNGKYI